MKKRFNPAWRIVVALILVFALTPVIALSVPVQALAAPDTYIDPIPDYVNELFMITGTSSSSAPLDIDIVKVQISYKDGTTTYYWDEDSADWLADVVKWGDANIWESPPEAACPWHWDWDYDTSIIPWDDGETYYIEAKALDEGGNPDPSSYKESFTIDETIPNTTIDAIADPYPGTPTTTLTSITGTAEDTTPGKIDAVRVAISRSDGAYLLGMAWITEEAWLPAVAKDGKFDETSDPWKIITGTTPSMSPWKHGETYTVQARAVDKAGNIDLTAEETFTYDVTLTGRDVYMDPIPEYATTSSDISMEITGTAKASTGETVNWVRLKIKCNTDSQYWNGGGWIETADTWSDATLLGSGNEVDWVYSSVPGWEDSKEYSVWSQVQDSTPLTDTTGEVKFTFDKTEPGSSINAIPDPVYNTLTSITGTAADTSPGEVAGMWVVIHDTSTGLTWDGTAWSAIGAGILTMATDGSFNSASEGWTITSTTIPPLPAWQNGHRYWLAAGAWDKAVNSETEGNPEREFTFRVKLTLPPPTPPTPTPTPDVTPPTLQSMEWIDVDGSGTINASDILRFNFSEAIDTTTLDTVSEINSGLDSSATGTDYGTTFTFSWNTAKTQLTVTLGTGSTVSAGDTVDPTSAVTDVAGNPDGTTALGPFVPSTPTATPTPAPTPTPTPTPGLTPTPTPTPTPTDTTGPILNSITWTDVDDSGTINEGDTLRFNFSEAMKTSTIDSVSEINSRLDSTASGTSDYGTTFTYTWTTTSQLTVTLGSDEAIEGGETVNPVVTVTDEAGNADATTGTGPAIEEPEEGFALEWWHILLIALGALIIIAAIVLLVVLPKRGGPEGPEEELYEEEEEF